MVWCGKKQYRTNEQQKELKKKKKQELVTKGGMIQYKITMPKK